MGSVKGPGLNSVQLLNVCSGTECHLVNERSLIYYMIFSMVFRGIYVSGWDTLYTIISGTYELRHKCIKLANDTLFWQFLSFIVCHISNKISTLPNFVKKWQFLSKKRHPDKRQEFNKKGLYPIKSRTYKFFSFFVIFGMRFALYISEIFLTLKKEYISCKILFLSFLSFR